MDRVVAIKMLHSNIKNDHVSLERFRMEAQAASSLSHQNIIAVYDFGVTEQGEAFFVMDFLNGEDLSDLIERKGRVPYERALFIFKQICDGLGAAHRKSIVHRDLKPANVVLSERRRWNRDCEACRLRDCEIAARIRQGAIVPHAHGRGFWQSNLHESGAVSGLELDKRSDIYALGCLMYETLTGEPPLAGESFLETLNMHVSATPKSFAEMVPDAKIPGALEQIIFRCMAKKPDDRPQNAEEIRDQLSALTLALSSHRS